MPNLTPTLEGEDRQTIRNMVTGDNNILINPNKVINQRAYAGGVLADGVYGYDRWKGADSDANIEQIIEQLAINTGVHTASWVGGGTATVAGVSGLSSGDSLTITVSGNISAKFPKASTKMKLEPLEKATPFVQRAISSELSLCQRYYETGSVVRVSDTSTGASNSGATYDYKVDKRAIPTIIVVNVNATGVDTASTVWGVGDRLKTLVLYHNVLSSPTQFVDDFTANSEL